jgi:aryl-phospho-beta-D-glucosidase BglC (GH1 family)
MRKIILMASFFLCSCVALWAIAKPHPHKIIADKPGKFGTVNQIGSGINIHFVSGHEKDLDMIAAAGFKFVRIDFQWQGIEHTKGVYDWSAFDGLMANLKKRNMRAICILDYSNRLYEADSVSINPLDHKEQRATNSPQHPESIEAFARWAAAAAVHFKASNIVWELWNEPNISFWKPKPNVNQYTALALATAKAIKAAQPDALIIGPCTSQVPLPYIETFMASGILQYLDAVSVHPYRNYSKSPETAIVDYNNLHTLIEKYAPDGKKQMPVISSEWGYSTSTKGVTLDVQAAYIVRMQLANLLYGVPISIWYDWKNDGTNPAEHEENFGTVTADLQPKPSYNAAQAMNSQLNEFTFVQRLNVNNENDYVLVFKNNKGKYKLAAWTSDAAHTITLNNKIPKLSRATLVDGNGALAALKTEQGSLSLALGALPQYVALAGNIAIN